MSEADSQNPESQEYLAAIGQLAGAHAALDQSIHGAILDRFGVQRSLARFLETYTLETVHGSQLENKGKDHVVLITVHSAKGTEAPIVFILNATRFSHSRAKTADEVEEERRILYVAITRPECPRNLVQSGARRRLVPRDVAFASGVKGRTPGPPPPSPRRCP